MKSLKDFNFENKKVLIRADFNVPLSGKGDISDDFRIRKTIPTIEYLIGKKAKIILMSHLGRPKGKVVEELRLTPIQARLAECLNTSIIKTTDCVGPNTEKRIQEMQAGEILLLENIQFHPGETSNDVNFAKTLAGYGDIFVMEAFGQAHRDYASITGIPKYLPSAGGFLLEKEIKALSQVIKEPKRPLVVIIGGKKIADKAKVAEKFSKMADSLLLGDLVADEIKKGEIKIRLEKIIFPIEAEEKLDISPKTVKIFKKEIKGAKTVFWAGPLGKIEEKKYQKGTRAIARAVIKSGAFSVIGGGDTLEFINKDGLAEKFSHVSTGGGAMLDFLAGEKIPGIEALKNGN